MGRVVLYACHQVADFRGNWRCTVELIHMLILKNCPQDEQLLRFIKFCESKFEFKYPVTLSFKPKLRGYASGVYRSSKHLVEIDMAAARIKFDALTTIAHELRHVYQHMYDTPEWNGTSKVCERDARTWASTIVEEFGGVEKDLALWIKRVRAKVSWYDIMHEPN